MGAIASPAPPFGTDRSAADETANPKAQSILCRCHECAHVYLQDLPSGHGLVYPGTFDVDTGESFTRPLAEGFGEWIGAAWQRPDTRPVRVRAERRRTVGRVTLLNCLDQVYGHSLLKLLNVQAELREGEVVAIVPESLIELVPADVAEVWFGMLSS